MKRSLMIMVLVGAVFGDTAFAGWCGKHPRRSTRQDDGTSIGLFIGEDQILATQKWSPDTGDPPLPPSKAWKLATEWAEKRFPRYDRIEIRSLDLTRYSCSSAKDHWYYLVEYTPMINGNRLHGSGNWVAVLMDGTLIAPRKYTDPFR